MDPQILFNNDSRYIASDDVPDLCEMSTENVSRMLEGQSIDDYGPPAKRSITSPNSQDLLCLIVAKMLNPDGQWIKLFTKLMYAEKCSAVEILGIHFLLVYVYDSVNCNDQTTQYNTEESLKAKFSDHHTHTLKIVQ